MKLVAMMIVKDEADRYLRTVLDSLLTYVDEIRVVDDGSTDEFREIDWYDDERVVIQRNSRPRFYAHEGQARQELLDWTMRGQPTHILALDADEILADGQALRAAMEEGYPTGVWKLRMEEVWKASEDGLMIRWDGDWKPRPIGIAFEVPEMRRDRQTARHWRINPAALASGRTPLYITQAGNRTTAEPVTSIFHFGWACEADRDARYQRYVVHDGGQFHKNKHLESIMFDDGRVETRHAPWPPALDREALLARINRGRS